MGRAWNAVWSGPESQDDRKASVHEGSGDFLFLGAHPWGLKV